MTPGHTACHDARTGNHLAIRRRNAFTLIELFVVITVIGVLIGLLLPAVQRVREAANRIKCQNNLKQLGLALHNYHGTEECFPPGMISSTTNVSNAEATGFTFLLPHLEQDSTYRLYHFDQPWWDASNYAAVGTSVKTFLCPSNRGEGSMDLAPIAAQWSTPLPPLAGSTDYAFCHGANGALHNDWNRIPASTRGVFNVRRPGKKKSGVSIGEIWDGTSMTFAMGDAAGDSPLFLTWDVTTNPPQPAIDPLTGQPVQIEQSWSAAGAGDPAHPWYGSVFAVTAQYGVSPGTRDEPMNRRPTAPTIWGNDPAGNNALDKDKISGFRSRHSGGCNFLFCDGAVRFVADAVSPSIYRALSTYMGGEAMTDP